MTTQLGLELQRQALAQSQQGREERIQAVRRFLWGPDAQVARLLGKERTLTADDAMEAAETLGLLSPGEESRWIAHVFLNWDRVENTGQVVRSRRAVNHGRRISLWRWR